MANEWNEITLDTPVALDITQPVWIGYYIVTNGAYSAGTGTGYPDPNSDWLTQDGVVWEHLTEYIPDTHWSISALVETVSGKEVSIGSTISDNASYSGIGSFEAGIQNEVSYPDPSSIKYDSKELVSYNVFRDGQQIATDITETTYEDVINGLGTYCYEVTAVYSICGESDPSNEVCIDVPVILSFDPETQSVHKTQSFSNAIQIEGAQNLGGFEMEVVFDPLMLQLNAVSLGDFLESTGRQILPLTEVIDNTNGLLTYAVSTQGDQPAGPDGIGVLLELDWTATSDIDDDMETWIHIQNQQINFTTGTIMPSVTEDAMVEVVDCHIHDFDCDCDVDIVDITMTAYAYGTVKGDAEYNVLFDLDMDGDIDIVDITMVAYDYGWMCGQKSAKLSYDYDPTEIAGLSLSQAQLVDQEHQIFEQQLYIENIEDLGAYEVLLNYDPQSIQVLEIKTGGFLETSDREMFGVSNTFDNYRGEISYAVSGLGFHKRGASGMGRLISIRYQSADAKSPNLIVDVDHTQLLRPNAEPIPFKLKSNTAFVLIDQIVAVYPSPAKESFTVDYSISASRDAQVVIYDVYGKMIYLRDVNSDDLGVQSVRFEEVHLQAGVYQVGLMVDGKIQDVKKLVIH